MASQTRKNVDFVRGLLLVNLMRDSKCVAPRGRGSYFD